ncbi:MAG: hypothetical protein ACRDJE_12945 [Dehalococcoidia bacterium]
MRSTWDALAVGEGGVTAVLAGISAVYFLRRHARARDLPGQQLATLAMGMSAAGAALVAAQNMSASVTDERSSGLSLLVGLPALAGQALVALLVLRRRSGR